MRVLLLVVLIAAVFCMEEGEEKRKHHKAPRAPGHGHHHHGGRDEEREQDDLPSIERDWDTKLPVVPVTFENFDERRPGHDIGSFMQRLGAYLARHNCTVRSCGSVNDSGELECEFSCEDSSPKTLQNIQSRLQRRFAQVPEAGETMEERPHHRRSASANTRTTVSGRRGTGSFEPRTRVHQRAHVTHDAAHPQRNVHKATAGRSSAAHHSRRQPPKHL